MKEKILAHMGSLLSGVVHNLNTPLMWVMGRAQLVQSRIERLASQDSHSKEEIASVCEKSLKDLGSIIEGAEKIDAILKGLGYKIHMVNEGFTAVELREYLEMEMNFLMADMRFKHDTTKIIELGGSAHYTKVDYNALSSAVTGVIHTMIDRTNKGRTIRVALNGSVIHLAWPELKPDDETRRAIDEATSPLAPMADIFVDDSDGLAVAITVRDR